jgi:hypothetical protein
MLRVAVFVALIACASGSAVEMTKTNFQELVVDSGKNAFVKFLAPW